MAQYNYAEYQDVEEGIVRLVQLQDAVSDCDLNVTCLDAEMREF